MEIEGWQLPLFNDGITFDYCEYCRSPDGRVGHLNSDNVTELILSTY
ncbi:DUF7693 family protein [Pseudomonas sp. MDT2-39-1]